MRRVPDLKPCYIKREAWEMAARDCSLHSNALHGAVLRGAFGLADGAEIVVNGQARGGRCDLMLEFNGQTWRRRDAPLADALAGAFDAPQRLVERRLAAMARDAACVLVARKVAAELKRQGTPDRRALTG